MRKRWFLVGMIFLLVPWLLVGCGVAQEEYDKVVYQLDTARAELQSVKAELDATKAKVSELTASLDKTETEKSELSSSLETTQSELEGAKSEYATFKSDVKSTWDRFDKIVGLEWYIVGYWSAAAQQNTELIEQRTAKMVTYVQPVGDSVLTTLWQQALDAAGKGQETVFLESFAAMMDRNSKLLTDQVKAIRSKLAK